MAADYSVSLGIYSVTDTRNTTVRLTDLALLRQPVSVGMNLLVGSCVARWQRWERRVLTGQSREKFCCSLHALYVLRFSDVTVRVARIQARVVGLVTGQTLLPLTDSCLSPTERGLIYSSVNKIIKYSRDVTI